MFQASLTCHEVLSFLPPLTCMSTAVEDGNFYLTSQPAAASQVADGRLLVLGESTAFSAGSMHFMFTQIPQVPWVY